MDKERSGLITNGPPAQRLCGLPIVGEVRVALDRDRRVVDIRDDVGHRRGDIRLQGRYWGLTRPRPLKDSLRRQVRPSPLRDDDDDGSASDAAAVGERPCFLLPLWLLLLSPLARRSTTMDVALAGPLVLSLLLLLASVVVRSLLLYSSLSLLTVAVRAE